MKKSVFLLPFLLLISFSTFSQSEINTISVPYFKNLPIKKNNTQDYLHDLNEYEEMANKLGPYPHNLFHYCEEAYKDSLKETSDGWYWALVTDGYGSLENYKVGVKDNAIYELIWEYPHEDSLILENPWDLRNGIYLHGEDYFFVIYKKHDE